MKLHLSPKANISGTSGLTILELLPIDLVETFGKPAECDMYKISGMYIFTNDKGDIFTIYDWKETTLFWGENSDCLTPEEFWQDDELHTFQIGGNNKNKLTTFMKWLCDEFEKPKLPVLRRKKAVDSKNLLPVYIGGKYGYIDTDGDLVFEPVFDEASIFSDGLAWVKIENSFGYINAIGEFVIEPIYEEARCFREGVAIVKRRRRRFVINSDGATLFKISGDFYTISEDLICKKEKKKWGYINKLGVTIIPFQFDLAASFSEGLANVYLGNEYGFINKHGDMVFKTKCRWIGSFSDGFARFRAKNRKYGYIDKSGNQVIPAKFDSIGIFREGLAAVKVKNKWGYIDVNGNYVIEPQFEDASLPPLPFKESLACVKFGELFGFIDKKGQMVIPAIFHFPWSFSKGIAGNAKIGYINKEGNYIWHPDTL